MRMYQSVKTRRTHRTNNYSKSKSKPKSRRKVAYRKRKYV